MGSIWAVLKVYTHVAYKYFDSISIPAGVQLDNMIVHSFLFWVYIFFWNLRFYFKISMGSLIVVSALTCIMSLYVVFHSFSDVS